jgi:hypothetical protein
MKVSPPLLNSGTAALLDFWQSAGLPFHESSDELTP